MAHLRHTFADVRQCPCGGETQVIETRVLECVTRRRKCTSCGDVCTTMEISSADFWRYIRQRNHHALDVAAAYLKREANRLRGGEPEPLERVNVEG